MNAIKMLNNCLNKCMLTFICGDCCINIAMWFQRRGLSFLLLLLLLLSLSLPFTSSLPFTFHFIPFCRLSQWHQQLAHPCGRDWKWCWSIEPEIITCPGTTCLVDCLTKQCKFSILFSPHLVPSMRLTAPSRMQLLEWERLSFAADCWSPFLATESKFLIVKMISLTFFMTSECSVLFSFATSIQLFWKSLPDEGTD